ncbi:hypothetical protein WAI453_003360 [Rhynchosporium graminicola]
MKYGFNKNFEFASPGPRTFDRRIEYWGWPTEKVAKQDFIEFLLGLVPPGELDIISDDPKIASYLLVKRGWGRSTSSFDQLKRKAHDLCSHNSTGSPRRHLDLTGLENNTDESTNGRTIPFTKQAEQVLELSDGQYTRHFAKIPRSGSLASAMKSVSSHATTYEEDHHRKREFLTRHENKLYAAASDQGSYRSPYGNKGSGPATVLSSFYQSVSSLPHPSMSTEQPAFISRNCTHSPSAWSPDAQAAYQVVDSLRSHSGASSCKHHKRSLQQSPLALKRQKLAASSPGSVSSTEENSPPPLSPASHTSPVANKLPGTPSTVCHVPPVVIAGSSPAAIFDANVLERDWPIQMQVSHGEMNLALPSDLTLIRGQNFSGSLGPNFEICMPFSVRPSSQSFSSRSLPGHGTGDDGNDDNVFMSCSFDPAQKIYDQHAITTRDPSQSPRFEAGQTIGYGEGRTTDVELNDASAPEEYERLVPVNGENTFDGAVMHISDCRTNSRIEETFDGGEPRDDFPSERMMFDGDRVSLSVSAPGSIDYSISGSRDRSGFGFDDGNGIVDGESVDGQDVDRESVGGQSIDGESIDAETFHRESVDGESVESGGYKDKSTDLSTRGILAWGDWDYDANNGDGQDDDDDNDDDDDDSVVDANYGYSFKWIEFSTIGGLISTWW